MVVNKIEYMEANRNEILDFGFYELESFLMGLTEDEFERAEELAIAFSRVKKAVCKDVTKHILTGINLNVSEGKAYLTATDGHYIAQTSMAWDDSQTFNITIPPKLFEILSEKGKGDIEFWHDHNIACIQRENVTVMQRILTAKFPDVGNLDGGSSAVLDWNYRQGLLDNLAIAKAYGSKTVDVAIAPSEYYKEGKYRAAQGELILAIDLPDIGSMDYRLPVQCYESQKVTVNIQALENMINSLPKKRDLLVNLNSGSGIFNGVVTISALGDETNLALMPKPSDQRAELVEVVAEVAEPVVEMSDEDVADLEAIAKVEELIAIADEYEASRKQVRIETPIEVEDVSNVVDIFTGEKLPVYKNNVVAIATGLPINSKPRQPKARNPKPKSSKKFNWRSCFNDKAIEDLRKQHGDEWIEWMDNATEDEMCMAF